MPILKMRKIERNLENPIDDILIEWADKVCPFFKATNHTPNVITTYSFASALGSLAALWHDKIALFCVLWILGYFFDCVDGHFARKYDMVTEFGDAYDHFTDVLVAVGLVVVLMKKFRIPTKIFVLLSTAVIFLAIHAACQQSRFASEKAYGETLDTLKSLCGGPEWIHTTKYFGFGTFQALLIFVVLYLYAHAKK